MHVHVRGTPQQKMAKSCLIQLQQLSTASEAPRGAAQAQQPQPSYMLFTAMRACNAAALPECPYIQRCVGLQLSQEADGQPLCSDLPAGRLRAATARCCIGVQRVMIMMSLCCHIDALTLRLSCCAGDLDTDLLSPKLRLHAWAVCRRGL